MQNLRALASGLAAFAFLLIVAVPAGATTIQRVVSPKGIEAWLVEEHSVPLIAISFAFVGGASQDPAARPGVANMVSSLLDEGAGDLDSQAFQAALDRYSIELSFNDSLDSFSGTMRTLVENRDQATHLLKLALTSPHFDKEPVERIRAQIIANIRSDERDPGSVGSDALMATLFPGHPYGRPTDGTIDSVTAITRDDLKAWFAHNIARSNLKIAVVGSIDAATLAKVLDEVFGDLPEKADLRTVAEIVPAKAAPVEIGMDIPQTVISFAAEGMKRDDPDFIPATVAAYILGGGGMSSRLYSEVREKRGLAYSVELGLSPLDHAGLIYAGTSTRADQANDVVKLVQDVVHRFADEGPTEKELADAKSYLIGSYPLRFDTSTKIAGLLLSIQLDDLGIDYIDKRNDMIAAVTIEDVRRVAKRLFGQDMVVVRVGQPSG
jgi:zinc protease